MLSGEAAGRLTRAQRYASGLLHERCFLPIHVYDMERSRPVAVVLRPGKTPSGIEVRAHVRRLVRRIHARWPKTRILLRGDGHYPVLFTGTGASWWRA